MRPEGDIVEEDPIPLRPLVTEIFQAVEALLPVPHDHFLYAGAEDRVGMLGRRADHQHPVSLPARADQARLADADIRVDQHVDLLRRSCRPDLRHRVAGLPSISDTAPSRRRS